MVKLIIDLAQCLYSVAPLLFSLAVLTLSCILLSRSIKKYATVYYTILSIPFLLVAISFISRLLGHESFDLIRTPYLGQVLRDYVHIGTFGFPLLIIIMYMGALNPKTPGVKKLLNIRKELSIISGFPVLAHSLVRVTYTFPDSLGFFTDNAGYMASREVVNKLGAGITNFSFVLGIVLVILFIPLWVTSFGSIHKRMGNARWKRLQKWAYVMYAFLFIHAMGIQAGYLLNPRIRQGAGPATVEVMGYIHIVSLILIFGSYLYLRLGKAKKDARKRSRPARVG